MQIPAASILATPLHLLSAADRKAVINYKLAQRDQRASEGDARGASIAALAAELIAKTR